MKLALKLEPITAEHTSKHDMHYPASIKVNDRGFYLSKAACQVFNITPGKYLHMIKGKNDKGVVTAWYITVNDVKYSGSKINAAKNDGAIVCNLPLSRLFRQEVHCDLNTTYYLVDTKSDFEGSRVLEIKTDRAIITPKRNKK